MIIPQLPPILLKREVRDVGVSNLLVAVAEASKLLLARSIPDVEEDLS